MFAVVMFDDLFKKNSLSSDDAALVFVLNDRLKKTRAFSNEDFHRCYNAELSRLKTLPSNALRQLVSPTWPQRQALYYSSVWAVQDIKLGECNVWGCMGGRPWAIGTVASLAPQFKTRPDDEVIKNLDTVTRTQSKLPLIVIKTSMGLYLDDGNHRAISYYLLGISTLPALVGCPNDIELCYHGI